jgi:hypothetical protein
VIPARARSLGAQKCFYFGVRRLKAEAKNLKKMVAFYFLLK